MAKRFIRAVKTMTLADRIMQIDWIQARRYSKLEGDVLKISTEGIVRHLRACARLEVNPDACAIREIMDDAHNGRRIYAEGDEVNCIPETERYFKLDPPGHFDPPEDEEEEDYALAANA